MGRYNFEKDAVIRTAKKYPKMSAEQISIKLQIEVELVEFYLQEMQEAE